jgi:hypothetical protein
MLATRRDPSQFEFTSSTPAALGRRAQPTRPAQSTAVSNLIAQANQPIEINENQDEDEEADDNDNTEEDDDEFIDIDTINDVFKARHLRASRLRPRPASATQIGLRRLEETVDTY